MDFIVNLRDEVNEKANQISKGNQAKELRCNVIEVIDNYNVLVDIVDGGIDVPVDYNLELSVGDTVILQYKNGQNYSIVKKA